MVADVLTPSMFIKGIGAILISGFVGIGGTVFTIGQWTSETESTVANHEEEIEEIKEIQDADHDVLIRVEERQQVILKELDSNADKLDRILERLE